jgi:DNA polymerase III epsilon subunit-like protein
MPHAVQFAFSLLDTSSEDANLVNFNYYLKIPVAIENSHIHGVTKEMSDAGCDFDEAFAVFIKLYNSCDKIVAHNIDFDVRMIRIECFRRGIEFKVDQSKQYCTMYEGAKVWGSKKWPKLAELYLYLHGKSLLNLHDASVDVKACLRCYGTMTSTAVPSAEALGLKEIDPEVAKAFEKLKL